MDELRPGSPREEEDEVDGQASFERIVGLSRGFWPARVLLTGMELDLFTVLGGQRLTAHELASRLQADPRGVQIVANALVALELLALDDGRYRNSPASRRYLDSSSAEYRGDVFLHEAGLWESWSRLTAVVKEGSSAIAGGGTPADTRHFILAMHQRLPHGGGDLVEKLDLHGVQRIIDIGGGSGTYAEAFVEALPEAQAVVVDLPEVIEIARERLPADLVDERIVLVARDFMADGIPLAGNPPGPYDLALLSAVIHIYGPEENAALLSRVYDALHPGGRVVIRDFLVDEQGTDPPAAALFAVNMLVNTKTGRCYSFEEIRGWLHAAGFGEVDSQPLVGATHLVTARRA